MKTISLIAQAKENVKVRKYGVGLDVRCGSSRDFLSVKFLFMIMHFGDLLVTVTNIVQLSQYVYYERAQLNCTKALRIYIDG